MIHNSNKITVVKQHWKKLWLGVTTTWGIVLKDGKIWKVENHWSEALDYWHSQQVITSGRAKGSATGKLQKELEAKPHVTNYQTAIYGFIHLSYKFISELYNTPTNIHHLKKSKQFPTLPLSTIFDPEALSGTVRWSWLLLSEEVSSLDKEFKNPLSEVTELFSGACQLLASEHAGVWTWTVNARGCPTSSATGALLTRLFQDCLSLDPEEENGLGAFTAFSREEKEHDESLSLGEEDDARRAAYFPQMKSGGRGGETLWLNYHSLHFVFTKILPELFEKVTRNKKVKGPTYDTY